MIGELYHIACGRCGLPMPPEDLNTIEEPWAFIRHHVFDRHPTTEEMEDGVSAYAAVPVYRYEPTALFTSHSEAMRAATKRDWKVVSESVGGDLCPTCAAAEYAEITIGSGVGELLERHQEKVGEFLDSVYDEVAVDTKPLGSEPFERCTYCRATAVNALGGKIPVCAAHWDALYRPDE